MKKGPSLSTAVSSRHQRQFRSDRVREEEREGKRERENERQRERESEREGGKRRDRLIGSTHQLRMIGTVGVTMRLRV